MTHAHVPAPAACLAIIVCASLFLVFGCTRFPCNELWLSTPRTSSSSPQLGAALLLRTSGLAPCTPAIHAWCAAAPSLTSLPCSLLQFIDLAARKIAAVCQSSTGPFSLASPRSIGVDLPERSALAHWSLTSLHEGQAPACTQRRTSVRGRPPAASCLGDRSPVHSQGPRAANGGTVLHPTIRCCTVLRGLKSTRCLHHVGS